MAETHGYERWIWTELLAFDVNQPDLDAQKYLDSLGFVPDVISLLISAADMVIVHESLEKDRILPGDYCSRDGHDGNEIRRRQVWTAYKLRDLITRLKQAGVKVYLSGFVHYLNNEFHHEWLSDHPECKQVMVTIGRCDALNILSRMSDGAYLEDLYARQLVRVCQDYGFDGWHGPDGYGPLNTPLHIVDCSDDMIGQFIESGQRELPDEVTAPSQDKIDNLRVRVDWIWRHRRMEWIAFYVDRWARFWGKIANSLHAIGRKAVVNSAWTRDPFEAIYRYGVDYRKLIEAGVDGIVVETVAGGQTLLDNSRNYHYDYLAMLLLIKAHVPNTKLICLSNTKDVVEDWDLLRHGPATIERESYALSNIYYVRKEGGLTRCADGFLACLGDGITREEWHWLDKQWQMGFGPMPKRVVGATLVWSDESLYSSVAEYPKTRRWSTHRLTHKLMEHDAPIHCAVDIDAIDRADGPLFVPNPHLLSPEHRHRLLESGKTVIAVGPDFTGWPKPSLEMVDSGSTQDAMRCRLYNGDCDVRMNPPVDATAVAPLADDRWNIPDPPYYRNELIFTPVSVEFLKACAELIRKVSRSFTPGSHLFLEVTKHIAEIGVMMNEQSPGVFRMALRNMDGINGRPKIDVGRKIDRVKVLSSFPVTTVRPNGSEFTLVVPPRGVVVCDVYTTGQGTEPQ
ncbi:MAG: hypothetical protein IT447_04095 [Phycisphaerales bacterium]|nr:hypothetical protein [Phycisphaerales bacterium]